MPLRPTNYIVFLIAALCTLFRSSGQELPSLHYGIEEGLPSNNVYSVYRDSRGFLWFSTDKGIARYNGLTFESFTTSNGLSDNEIFFFQEDREKRLWMGAYNGELCYFKDGVFHNASNTPFLKIPVKTSFTRYINIEYDSSITITYYNASQFVNITHDRCRVYDLHIEHDPIFMHRVLQKKKLPGGRFLITAQGSQQLIDSNSKTITEHLLNHRDLSEMVFAQDQHHFHDQHTIYDKDFKQLGSIPGEVSANHSRIYTIYTDSNIFLATDNGLYINGNRHILPGNKVSCITQDISGNYWISTLNNGAFFISRNLDSRVLSNAYEGDMQFCQSQGGKEYCMTDKCSLYAFSGDSLRKFFNYNTYRNTPPNTTYTNTSFYVDSNLKCYLFNFTHITIIKDVSAPTLAITERRSEDTATFDARDLIYEDGNFYFKRPAGILKANANNIERSSGRLIKHWNITPWSTHDRIFGMAVSPENNIWYSTLNKIYKLNGDTIQVQQQFSDLQFKNFSFFRNYLVGYNFYNKLMVCSNYNGRPYIDTIANQNCVWDKFYTLDAGHILISTNNFYRILTLPESGTRKCTIRALEDPFVPIQAENIFVSNGNCYFMKKNTLTRVSISSILAQTAAPLVFFKFIKTPTARYAADSVVTVPYRESRNITIKIAALLFGSKNLEIQYSISKNDIDNWRNTKSEEINLVNPDYGTYNIKVRAKTLSSNFSKEIKFTLVITHPAWATWWFALSVLCLLAFIIIVIVRYRLKLALRRNAIEHQREIRFVKSEYKALNALMNPHFIFNTLNNVQSLVNKDEKRAANEYLRIFANLIRQNMHNTSLELISLEEETDLVNNYLKLEKLRFKDLLNYEIVIDEHVDTSEIMIPPMLIQPLVENAIKHGIFPRKSTDSKIVLEIYERNDELCIVVKDNGIGMAEAQKRADPEHKSFGLDNIRKRLRHVSMIQDRKINLDIGAETDGHNQSWTIVTITIDLSESNKDQQSSL